MTAPPKQTWILDSVDPLVHNVLKAISALPTPVPSKSWVVETLQNEQGRGRVAQWMATNLRANETNGANKSFDWIFDLGIANVLVDNLSDQKTLYKWYTKSHTSATRQWKRRRITTPPCTW